jgi:hypothetical protein
MADIIVDARTGESLEPQQRLRSDWKRRLLNELFALFVALLFLLAGLLVLLDSAPGHRWIIDRIAGLETASGLRIRIGRIDGSIFGNSQLRNVTVADGRGVFLTSPNIKLDWTPGAWLDNKLYVDSLTAERVALIRLPKLKPNTKKGTDPSRLRHSHRRAEDRPARHWAAGGRKAAQRQRPRQGRRSLGPRIGRAAGAGEQWRRPHRSPLRRRA